ncbi:hypothetical protein [Microbispora rosea]|uniref:hypothetical protein n=1 Tax=Microbispora rosea TaxID=58117 RepID=UPI003D94F154
MGRRRRSPQEKKALSYAKDRRNNYGENDKSSRKNIARSKKFPHRVNRRNASVVLEAATGVLDEVTGAAAEERLLARRPKSWKKWSDAPLGEVVQDSLRRRVDLGRDGRESGTARIRRVRRRMRQPAE